MSTAAKTTLSVFLGPLMRDQRLKLHRLRLCPQELLRSWNVFLNFYLILLVVCASSASAAVGQGHFFLGLARWQLPAKQQDLTQTLVHFPPLDDAFQSNWFYRIGHFQTNARISNKNIQFTERVLVGLGFIEQIKGTA